MSILYLPKRSERNLTKAILRELCYLPDTFAWEMDTKGTGYVDKLGRQKYIPTLSRGKPDIGGCKGSFSFVMEVKNPGEKLAPHQQQWRDCYLEKTSGWYFVVRDTGQAYQAWRGIGIICYCGRLVSIVGEICKPSTQIKSGLNDFVVREPSVIVCRCVTCMNLIGWCECVPIPCCFNWKE